MNRELRQLLAMIDEAYEGKSWHGPNLSGSIRGLLPEEAARRPGTNRHSIQEIVVHAAYWKYAVWRRLTGEKRGSFPEKGSNWFARRAGASSWKDDVAMLHARHRLLRKTVAQIPPGLLRGRPPGSRRSRETLIRGIAAHDLYHAGQIRLLKVLLKKKRAR